jgi:adenosine deaminase
VTFGVVTRAWLRKLPKAELHVHLEGTMSPAAYARIARRNGMPVPEDPDTLFACRDFPTFLAAFVNVVKALQTPEDVAELAGEYLACAARDGVRHVEFLFSPATIRYLTPRADLPGMLRAIAEACRAARRVHGISSLLIIDFVRNLGEHEALADLDLAVACPECGIAGVGLGGDEARFPATAFVKAFDRAAKLGLHRTAHAGEAAGPESVRAAIEQLHAERIGHGVAAASDESVLELIAERNVAIDCCLTSNKLTGALPEGARHPLTLFVRRGLIATLSTDDPSFFHTTLLDEYERALRLGLTRDDLIRLACNSFEASFADADAKRAWQTECRAYGQASQRACTSG